MQHAFLRTKPSRVWWFRVLWNKIEYACREGNGSLKPVPPGTTREQLYCGQCTAAKCLFAAPGYDFPHKVKEDGRKTAPARARAKGLAGNGRPLKATCWNCQEIRCKLAGYVCRFESEAEPVTQRAMTARNVADIGCNRFGLRRAMEIPPLDGDGNA